MEKKTIGKFIQALRRANGMTQKDLGDRLFVSDKTVSRWECDECTPELSLIPVIAEVFGITADELLRGERNNPARSETAPDEAKQRAKSEKQFKRMLQKRTTRYNNLTLISYGISAAGLIAATICNLGFLRGTLGFWISMIFLTASVICQLCFCTNAKLQPDEDDETYAEEIQKHNIAVANQAIHLVFVNLLLFAFLLPIGVFPYGTYMGLTLESWFGAGILFALIAAVVLYIVYTLFLRHFLTHRGFLESNYEEAEREQTERNRKRMKKTVMICAPIAAVLGIAVFVWNVMGYDAFYKGETFYSYEEFQAFMENVYQTTYGYIYEATYWNNGEVNISTNVDFVGGGDGYEKHPTEEEPPMTQLLDRKGNALCEYVDCGNAIQHVEYDPNDGLPITVYTEWAWRSAVERFEFVLSVLYILIVLDVAAGCLVYTVLTIKNERKAKRI